jgi:predicted aminopeptidase
MVSLKGLLKGLPIRAGVLSLMIGLSGCAAQSAAVDVETAADQGPSRTIEINPGFYWQAAAGHFAVMRAARPIEQWLDDPAASAALKERLRLLQAIRAFATDELHLPNNGSYTRYADLKQPFVVWNLFATAPLSMTLKQWCFPVAGCVSYRGYYSEKAAQTHAQLLREQEGLEVYVAGVPAYSTLGWFDDPALNTFLFYPPAELARLVFHELAHQLLYVGGDSTFNESFATAVEEIGVLRWLQQTKNQQHQPAYLAYQQRRKDFVDLLKRYREKLQTLLQTPGLDNATRLAQKAQLFEALRADYETLKKQQWGGFRGYDRWFAQPLTNAHLASVATYTDLVPGFIAIHQQAGADMAEFYRRVKALSVLPQAQRNAALQAPVGR